MRGVDIYRYQTVTDFNALARNVGFAWVKLTDGNGPAVVRGDRQVNGCRAAGIPTGGYHYAQPGDPIRQADVFLGELRRLNALDIAPALDLEAPFTPNNVARNFGIAFCQRIAARGHRPAAYMSASMAGVIRPDQWGIPGLVIWIAAYGGNDGGNYGADDPPKVRRYYGGRYDIHQHSSTAIVPGISGRVDLNWALTGVPKNGPVEGEVELTDMIPIIRPTDGKSISVSVGDILENLYVAEMYGSTNEPWKGKGSRQLLIELAGRPAATVDVSALATALGEELAARGIGGATPEQVTEAVGAAFARAGAAVVSP
jgi:GH25 family lysozyme M1 (1,4-beta-N-acetylmuramidase)